MRRLVIANRGEVAVRVARAAASLGIPTVALAGEDERDAPHVRAAGAAVVLPGTGPAAHLDRERVVAAARDAGASHLHPGWGLLSEDAGLARRCADAGIAFVGPSPAALALFGDKVAARAAAERAGLAVPAATAGPASLEDARAFVAEHGVPVIVKAVAGGGGRGMRVVDDPAGLDDAWRRCRAEAELATGTPDVYVERLVQPARHVEVQLLGDGAGGVVVLGDRDCSLQRRHQKVVELAPAPGLDPGLRAGLHAGAARLAAEARLASLATVELLLDLDTGRAVFIECNPRLQVEHTVTEAVTGLDLVALQLRQAAGASLAELGLHPGEVPAVRGAAVQLRVSAAGEGVVEALALPDGVRVDTALEQGARVSQAFDPLLLKIIAHDDDLPRALARAEEALAALELRGVATNAALLHALLADGDVRALRLHTGLADAVAAAAGGAGPGDPAREVASPLTGVVLEVVAPEGSLVRAGAPVLVLEAMKMHHEVVAPVAGRVARLSAAAGEHVTQGTPLFALDAADVGGDQDDAAAAEADLDHVRDDLAAVLRRRHGITDEGRPAAVARRHEQGRRTARENVEDLCDPGTFSEYGGLTVAAQAARRTAEWLAEQTPGDGMVCGTASVNGEAFGEAAAQCVVLSYDYTVLAGTQGLRNHRKTDRLLDLAARRRLPVVLFAEGGGGRPGDTDRSELFHLDVPTFAGFARLSGLVPRVGIVSGRCFAGNAALLGCADVIIATPDATIGMGGPAMIEGGGLGRVAAEDVGPVDALEPAGVIDVVVADEAEAVATARRFLGFFQGRVEGWSCADQRLLRGLVPEDPKRTHDARRVVEVLADEGSVLELRRGWGRGVVTALARIEGRPVGVLANDPSHLSGAVDAEASDKAARFVQLCDAFGLPVLSLVDTPGFMVGPDSEREAMVRRSSRLFVTAATMTAPWVCVVVRRAYGLGAMAMAGGGLHEPLLTVAWPTGEFGAMGVEGAVRLAMRRELEAIEDEAEREARVREAVAAVRANSGALSMAGVFEVDDVIDPADTRARIVAALRSVPPPSLPPAGRRRTMVDPW